MTNNKQPLVIGIIGQIAAGKTTITQYLEERYGATTFRFSTILRDILGRLYLEPSRTNLQTLSTALRTNFGQSLLSNTLAKDLESTTHPLCITEGIRRVSDISALSALPHLVLVYVDTDQRIRFERLKDRRENPDDAIKTWEQFCTDDTAEPEQEIRSLRADADVVFSNNGTVEELYAQIDALMQSQTSSL